MDAKNLVVFGRLLDKILDENTLRIIFNTKILCLVREVPEL